MLLTVARNFHLNLGPVACTKGFRFGLLWDFRRFGIEGLPNRTFPTQNKPKEFTECPSCRCQSGSTRKEILQDPNIVKFGDLHLGFNPTP